MLTSAIKEITVMCNEGAFLCYEHNKQGITEIIDKSTEGNIIFYVIKKDHVFVKLINVPVIVEYFD